MRLKDKVLNHWQRMRNDAKAAYENGEESPIGHHCAYCKQFNYAENHNLEAPDNCLECPIFEKTGKKGCEGTPYLEANDAWVDYRDSGFADHLREWWQLKADAMIKFLEGLPDE